MTTKPPTKDTPSKNNVRPIRQDEVTPASIVAAYNKEFAVCLMGTNAVILREQNDSVSFLRQKDLELFFKNETVQIKTQRGFSEMGQFPLWLKHPDRRTYRDVVFAPQEETPGDIYNLWRGWAVQPVKGDWSLLKQHIWENICNKDKAAFQWVISWLADGIQNPGKKPGTALVLRGKEGIGKGVFVSAYGSLFGAHYLPVSNSKHLLGNFNSHLANRLVVFADEAVWAGDKEGSGILKDLITGDTIRIERKGQDVIETANLIRLIMASNSDWVVPAGLDARRFCVLDVSEAHKQDSNYFATIQTELLNGGREAFFYDLLHFRISDVDLRNPPQTLALLKQKIATMEGVTRYWFNRLTYGDLPYGRKWDAFIPAKELLKQYQDEAHIIGERHKSDANTFSARLRALCPLIKPAQKRPVENSGNEDGRAYCYSLPTLEGARAAFEKVINQKVNWEEFVEDS